MIHSPTLEDELYSVLHLALHADDDGIMELVLTHRNALASLLGEPEGGLQTGATGSLVERYAERFTRALYQRNQFLHLSAGDDERLRQIYRRLRRDLGAALTGPAPEPELGERIRELVEGHRGRLDSFVRGLWRGPPEAEPFVLANVACSEYTPELQIQVLGIDPAVLGGPVLDIGCGPGAHLVRWLRQQGVDAHGIDRIAPDTEFVEVADWMSYDYGSRRWRALLSHLAFSNHFVMQDRCGGAGAEEYAKTYLAMLRSLRPGGSFHYAPSLPFMEQHLPRDRFRITHREVAREAFVRLGLGTDGAVDALSRSTRVLCLRQK